MHGIPCSCMGLTSQIVHNLPENRDKTQHSEIPCLGYLGAVANGRTLGGGTKVVYEHEGHAKNLM